jgi:small GTP-binding protein
MTLLEAHARIKTRLLARLSQLSSLADEVGLKTLKTDLETTRIPKLEAERFHLVVLGEFNHGKSTFVNALLGAALLPTGITPTTATINHVVFADPPRVRAFLDNGECEEVPTERLADWVTASGARAKNLKYVEVGVPCELLKDNLTLVDTPGVNDLNEQRAEITYGYVPRADAVLFLLDATQALKESERAFLTTRILSRSKDRMIFILGKRDLLSDKELADVETYVRTHLGKLVAEPPLFSVSAKRHLAGEEDQSGMAPLVQHLAKFLGSDRGRILLDNATEDALGLCAYLKQNLGVKRRSLELSVGELEERMGKIRTHLHTTQKSLAELSTRIYAEAEAVKARVRLDLDSFVARFQAVLPSEIDRVDAGDVKRYLPLFIQDKFKEWAEREGEVCGALLERLAEEVIAVTSENVRALATSLAEKLGPAETRVDFEVDSFKYDVSIYAVGALGTTVFLFVNTLVGGLLTLAAPILAIVLQSKVAAEIKDHAKNKAPEALERARGAAAPRFDEIVDDFAARLREFVIAAGDKLFRGLTEVLDQAIAERKTRGGEIAPLVEAVGGQVARLVELERALGELKAELWS